MGICRIRIRQRVMHVRKGKSIRYIRKIHMHLCGDGRYRKWVAQVRPRHCWELERGRIVSKRRLQGGNWLRTLLSQPRGIFSAVLREAGSGLDSQLFCSRCSRVMNVHPLKRYERRRRRTPLFACFPQSSILLSIQHHLIMPCPGGIIGYNAGKPCIPMWSDVFECWHCSVCGRDCDPVDSSDDDSD